MESLLHELIGAPVVRFETVEDYWQLVINESVISIMNPFVVRGASGHQASLSAGAVLQEVRETDDSFTFTFSDGTKLTIDLRDEAYVGPEAFVYHKPDGTTVVW